MGMAILLALAAAVSVVAPAQGATLSITVDRTLDNKPVIGTRLTMTLTSDKDYLTAQFTAPYFEGATNRVHLFLANSDHRITELQLTPSGSTLRRYWAPYNLLHSEALPVDKVTSSAEKGTWSGTVRVHRDDLPTRISLYNAAAVHPASASDPELQYDSLYYVTNYGIALPDLMVLPRYTAVGPRFFFDNDEGYSKKWKAAK